MKFLRNLLASIMGTIIAAGMLFLFFLLIVSLMSGSKETVEVKEKSVLEISFVEPLKDYGGKYHFVDLDFKYEDYGGLNNVLEAIKAAKTDSRIKGISIDNKLLLAGTAQVKAIRDAIIDFKTSGKFVYAYGDYYMQKDYYLASVADSVFLNPSGEMDFRGLSSEVLFFKDLQEKSGIKMEVIRHGKYKSAVEPFLSNEMSDANREQITSLLRSVWNSILEDVSESRNISVEKLNEYADNLAARTPEMAAESGLIDRLLFHDQYENLLRDGTGTAYNEDLNLIDIEDYAEHVASKRKEYGKKKIAVIYAQGEIVYGRGNDDVVGQGILVEALRDARNDDDVKGIVLRVDSPGGSALASDIIWREIEVTKKEKPVVVSMGNLAASGGYYIACGGDKIFAEPSTITGSIGVFGTIPNIEALATRWGINAEQVQTNKQSTGYSVFEPMTDEFRTFAQEGVESVYQTFLQRVAEGRNLTVANVDSIGQGRVWSGEQAIELGLVDEMGSLDDAINYTAGLAELDDFSTENYPVYDTGFEAIFSNLTGIKMKTKEELIREEIGFEAFDLLQKIKVLTQQKGVQARIPFELNIH